MKRASLSLLPFSRSHLLTFIILPSRATGSNYRYKTSHGSEPLGGFLLIHHQAFDSLTVL